jgi:hypothetical protein
MLYTSLAELADGDLIVAWRCARAVYEEATDSLRTVRDDRAGSQACLQVATNAMTEMFGIGKEAASRRLLLPTQLGS